MAWLLEEFLGGEISILGWCLIGAIVGAGAMWLYELWTKHKGRK